MMNMNPTTPSSEDFVLIAAEKARQGFDAHTENQNIEPRLRITKRGKAVLAVFALGIVGSASVGGIAHLNESHVVGTSVVELGNYPNAIDAVSDGVHKIVDPAHIDINSVKDVVGEAQDIGTKLEAAKTQSITVEVKQNNWPGNNTEAHAFPTPPVDNK
jgi:hypothetical protein